LKLAPALIAVLLLGASSLCRASSSSQRAHGEQVFNTSGCRQCHTVGKTGGTRGPNLSAIGKMLSKNAIRKQIVYGGKSMPPFGTILEKSDLNALVAYLQSLRGD
jgi:ubiquinol-cytochrome c reductase cytochrome b subunit